MLIAVGQTAIAQNRKTRGDRTIYNQRYALVDSEKTLPATREACITAQVVSRALREQDDSDEICGAQSRPRDGKRVGTRFDAPAVPLALHRPRAYRGVQSASRSTITYYICRRIQRYQCAGSLQDTEELLNSAVLAGDF